MNILIAEDNEHLLELLKDILSTEGYKVFTATNGKEALNILGAVQVDLIVTDLVMPDMEGLEFIQKIKSDKNTSIKIIAISGGRAGSGSYLNMARKFGADMILEKPFSNKTIVEAVQQLLS